MESFMVKNFLPEFCIDKHSTEKEGQQRNPENDVEPDTAEQHEPAIFP
jgi:hypothetical protein